MAILQSIEPLELVGDVGLIGLVGSVEGGVVAGAGAGAGPEIISDMTLRVECVVDMRQVSHTLKWHTLNICTSLLNLLDNNNKITTMIMMMIMIP